ncbi:MAG TPA: hypothetical protein VLZ33_05200 [Dysgonamonadaceae bacterium]|nr:hypothetical protein [Dysgonamonadaceae bacterium]
MNGTFNTIICLFSLLYFVGCTQNKQKETTTQDGITDSVDTLDAELRNAPDETSLYVDSTEYNQKMMHMVNGDTTGHWPVETDHYPLEGAILPYKRIVAYYGNMYSKNMGALGEYPPKEMWRMLKDEISAWQIAEPKTPVVPAIHYIATTAQSGPMRDSTYRMRMPKSQIDSALAIAKMEDALLFLDIQVGHSSVEEEVPVLEEYLKMSHVHLGIEPEFSMKDGSIPGKRIGTYDAEDINWCTEYLAQIVRNNNLPPKILVVHRFTQGMVTNYKNIKLRPEVQIVMHMDGWGAPQLKYSTYERYIRKEPVQFTGFKIFYKNDLKRPPHRLLTADEVMQLKPRPIYIQYQ